MAGIFDTREYPQFSLGEPGIPEVLDPNSRTYSALNPINPLGPSMTPIMDVVMALLKQHPGGEAWRGVSVGADLARDAMQRRAINNLRSATGIAYREGKIPSEVVPYGIFGGAGKPRALTPQEEAAATLGLSMHEDKDINYAKLIAEERERAEKAKFERAQAFTNLVAEGGVPYAVGVLKSLGIDPSEFANTPQPPGLTNMMYRQKQIEAENARIKAMGGGEDRNNLKEKIALMHETMMILGKTADEKIKQLNYLGQELKNPMLMADQELYKQKLQEAQDLAAEIPEIQRRRNKAMAWYINPSTPFPEDIFGGTGKVPIAEGGTGDKLYDDLVKQYSSGTLPSTSANNPGSAWGINNIYDWLSSLRSSGQPNSTPAEQYTPYVPSSPSSTGTGLGSLIDYWRNNGPFGPSKYRR